MASEPASMTSGFPAVSRTGGVSLVEMVLIAVLLLGIVVALQVAMGGYLGEFNDDEASHYISGLFLKEYVTTFPLRSPLDFVREFHSKYPLIGIGHWPPLYYVVEATWMMLFSSSKVSVIVLTAIVTLITGMTIYVTVANRFGRIAGSFAALAFVMAPVVQTGSSELMLDVPVALAALWAMLAYMRYLDTGRARYSVAFGLIASAAFMIKGNAASLALLPAFAILVTGRWNLLRKPSFWAPVPIVLILVGPWYVLTYGLVEQGFRFTWGLTYFTVATIENGRYLLSNLGLLVIVFAFVGLAGLIVRSGKPADNCLASASALFLSVWFFQTVIPAAIQDRYLDPALPGLVIMAVYGVHFVIARFDGLASRVPFATAAIFATLLVIPILSRGIVAPPKPIMGLAWAAKEAWSMRTARNPAVLVVANNRAEAAAIAELAMIDPDPPSLFAVRGSRIFGGGGYNAQDYLPRFKTPHELMQAIDEYSIPLVILQKDPSGKDWAHIRQVEEAIMLYPERWKLVARNADVSPEVSVFEVRGNETKEISVQKMMALTGPRSLGEP